MQPNYSQIQKKYWSPNSPYGDVCVFSAHETLSLCRRDAARLVSLPQAMAALTENMEPKRWRAAWLIKKFESMGMPTRLAENGMVLLFQPDFIASMGRVAMDEMTTRIQDTLFDAMVDSSRGGNGRRGMAVWTSRPTHLSKTAGAPAFKMRQMQVRFKPNDE